MAKKYKVQRVYVSAGTSETLAVEYEHTPDELYFWAFPDALQNASEINEGSIESWINAGKCIATGVGEYKFFGAFDCGYTVFVARKSEADTEPEQKPNAPFPLASLLKAIMELKKRSQEDAEEILRALRSPEADSKMILPTASQRAGKLFGFNDDGDPAIGKECRQFAQMMEAQINCESYVEQAKQYANNAEEHKKTVSWLADQARESRDETEELAGESKAYALEAQTWRDKTAVVGMNAISKVELSKGRAEQAAEEAKEAAARAEQAMNSAASGAVYLDQKLCYVGCAAKQAKEAREAIEAKVAELGEHVGNLEGYPTADDIESGIKTQSIIGHDGKKTTGNGAYLDGDNLELMSGGLPVKVPAKSGTVAMISDVQSAIASVYKYKGTVATESALPTSENIVGDVYNVTETGENFAWDGTKWDSLRGDIEYATAESIQAEINRAKAAEAGKVPLLETVPADGTGDVDAYGYLGTLRALGAFGDAVLVSKLSVFTRNSGNLVNSNVSLWCRILKAVEGAWVVVAQSDNPAKWSTYGQGAEIPFNMQPVAGVTPPSADEKIAIVFVNSATAAASTANGTLSFRSVSGNGGFATELSTNANEASSNTNWKPRIKLRFAPLSGNKQAATEEELNRLADVLAEKINLEGYAPKSLLDQLDARVQRLEMIINVPDESE